MLYPGVTLPVYHLGPSSLQRARLCSWRCWGRELILLTARTAAPLNAAEAEVELQWHLPNRTYGFCAKHFPEGDAKLLTSQLILQEQVEV